MGKRWASPNNLGQIMRVGNRTDIDKEEIFGFDIYSVLYCKFLNGMSGKRLILFTKIVNIDSSQRIKS